MFPYKMLCKNGNSILCSCQIRFLQGHASIQGQALYVRSGGRIARTLDCPGLFCVTALRTKGCPLALLTELFRRTLRWEQSVFSRQSPPQSLKNLYRQPDCLLKADYMTRRLKDTARVILFDAPNESDVSNEDFERPISGERLYPWCGA